MAMWEMSLIATTYKQRPSDIIGIDDDWAAYQLDQAVRYVGTYIHNKLMETDKKGKPIYASVGDVLGKPSLPEVSKLKNVDGLVVEKR